MIHEEQTLHDFVLNLLNDATARSAFGEDPTQALESAGLGDVTAQDVQEVVPLVMDYSGQLPALDSVPAGLGELPAGAEGIEGAIAQLQSVADAAGEQRSDVDAFSGVGEITGEFSEDGVNLGSSTDSAAGHFAAMGGAGLESAGGAAALDGDLASAGGLLDAGVNGVTGKVGVGSEQGSVAAFSTGGSDGVEGGAAISGGDAGVETTAVGSLDSIAAGGSVDTPLGVYGAEVFGDPTTPGVPDFATTGDLAGALDSDALARSSDPAASTLATFVTSDGAALGGLAPVALPAVPAVPELGSLPVDVPAGLPTGVPAGLPVDVPVDLPAAQLPELGSLPVDVPADLPADLPTDLPVDLPTDLPVSLPDLPVANPLPAPQDLPAAIGQGIEQGPITDGVEASPLGDIAGAAGDLPISAPQVGDLDLGL